MTRWNISLSGRTNDGEAAADQGVRDAFLALVEALRAAGSGVEWVSLYQGEAVVANDLGVVPFGPPVSPEPDPLPEM